MAGVTSQKVQCEKPVIGRFVVPNFDHGYLPGHMLFSYPQILQFQNCANIFNFWNMIMKIVLGLVFWKNGRLFLTQSICPNIGRFSGMKN